jgi:hypothetical protein
MKMHGPSYKNFALRIATVVDISTNVTGLWGMKPFTFLDNNVL